MAPIVLTHLPNAELQSQKDCTLNIMEQITKNGYIGEQHKDIETSDGYLLEIHRIPQGKHQNTYKRPVLLIMHGLMSCSQDFVNNGSKSFAYLAADRGYDVWIGNARGNKFGTKHVKLNPETDKEFWDFSWQEIGIFDLPATIDYILEVTKAPFLYYVGHSQGSCIMLTMLSEKPEYNEKIKCAVMLGPAVFLKDTPCRATQFFAHHPTIRNIVLRIIKHTDRMSKDAGILWLYFNYLIKVIPYKVIMSQIVPLLGPTNQIVPEQMPVILASSPAGCSTKQLLHYSQNIKTGLFRFYDYGPEENLTRYGNAEPKSFNLSNVKIPVFIHYGMTDYQISYKDTVILKDKLPNVVGFYTIPSEKFNHIDFLWARNAPSVLYEPVLDNLEVYLNKK